MPGQGMLTHGAGGCVGGWCVRQTVRAHAHQRPQDEAPHPPMFLQPSDPRGLCRCPENRPRAALPKARPRTSPTISWSHCKSQKEKPDFMWPNVGMWVNPSDTEAESGSIFCGPLHRRSASVRILPQEGWEVPGHTPKNGLRLHCCIPRMPCSVPGTEMMLKEYA